jgi:LysR family nitrogen assimilation transcriptional regulator
MDLKQLQYFIDVADALSFNRAAANIHVTQPALSRQIHSLEQELGVLLFDRHGRGVSLTEAGRLLRERADSILQLVAHVRDEVTARSDEPRGELVFGLPAPFRALIGGLTVAAYLQQYPAVRLRVLEAPIPTLRQMVLSGTADFSVITSIEPSSQLRCRPLVSEGLFLVGSPAATDAGRAPIAAERLAGVPLVQFSAPNSLRALIERSAARHGHVISCVLEVDGLDLMKELVRLERGFCVLPYCAIHRELRDGLLAAVPIVDLTLQWVTIVSAERNMSAAARRLHDTLADRVRALVMEGSWPTAVLDMTEQRDFALPSHAR